MGGYSKAKGRGGKKRSFVMIRYDIMESDAWRSLSPVARCVWTEVMHRYNSFNNGEISLSCREAANLCNVSKNTASKAFKDLQERGFLAVGVYSSFTCKYKRATRWSITHERLKDNPPTHQWKKYKAKI